MRVSSERLIVGMALGAHGSTAVLMEFVPGEDLRQPYGGASLFDIGMKQAAGAATVNMGDMPEGMAAAVRRAIAFDKDMRPASPVAFANELKRITKSE